MQEHPKLVVITRTDLTEGQQAVQSAHAAIDFTFEHPGRAGPWHKDSNYLILLAVNTEKQLKLLIERCNRESLLHTIFREPDLDNAITAIAIEPSPKTQRITQRIPLLFKSKTKIYESGTLNSIQNSSHES